MGDDTVIELGAVVTKYVSPCPIMAGNPARVLRHRFRPRIVELLLQVGWWDWPSEQILDDVPLLMSD
ncbi:LbetaH domain-containing protein [Methylococcus geothermalis]|uniref:Acetyltransferase n=1 Tax=Methylococcus geothermalis TaxID=2681310 RepID=A0A858Q9R0_9GAMM|nr:hypothetical protein [Methylococcus geothermalis]QJD30662.1 hypothetical protein GNH96_12205 [Methylococcus geothermalis]